MACQVHPLSRISLRIVLLKTFCFFLPRRYAFPRTLFMTRRLVALLIFLPPEHMLRGSSG